MVAAFCFVWPDNITGEERALIEARSVQGGGKQREPSITTLW
jgi:hypothetical protein